MPFDPSAIQEDTCGEGHLDEVPLHALLFGLLENQSTGRLSINDERGPNHVFFMRGQPVGVQLSTPYCPLGQLLLELRLVESGAYMRAQRTIVQHKRMPGQVFKELGIVDEERLGEVLSIQARRRFERFALMRARPFQFCKGLSFLAGFQRTPLDVHVLLFLAQKGQIPPGLLNDWMGPLRDLQIRLPADKSPLPASAESYDFGPPEQRFLERLASGWQNVRDLVDTGTLPEGQVALLLYHLEKLGRLQRRIPVKEPEPIPEELTPVFQQKPRSTPTPVSVPEGMTIDDVFSNTEDDSFNPDEFLSAGATDPAMRRQPMLADIHDVPTEIPARPKPISVPNSPSPGKADPAGATPVRVKFPSENTLEPAKKVKKKRTRRDAPEPSSGSAAISRTRKEKTNIGPMPSIVIEGMEDEG